MSEGVFKNLRDNMMFILTVASILLVGVGVNTWVSIRNTTVVTHTYRNLAVFLGVDTTSTDNPPPSVKLQDLLDRMLELDGELGAIREGVDALVAQPDHH